MTQNPALDALVEHVSQCLKPDATIVVDGNGDHAVAALEKMGYVWDGNYEYVGGKRIRMMVMRNEDVSD